MRDESYGGSIFVGNGNRDYSSEDYAQMAGLKEKTFYDINSVIEAQKVEK